MHPERYGQRVADVEVPDDELAHPNRSAAYLTILSDSASASELAQIVGLAPDESWSKGDRASQRVQRTQPHNGITYGSRLPESASPAKHLAALIALLKPYLENVAVTAADPSVLGATVWIVKHTEGDMTDIAAGPEDCGH
jgi:hypothetical protein